MEKNKSLKFTIPTLPDYLIKRPDLYPILYHSLEKGNVFLIGKPGCGKTTAAALWARTMPGFIIWMNIDALDNEETILLKNLAKIIPIVQKKTGQPSQNFPYLPQSFSIETFLTLLESPIDKKQIFIFDNFDLLTNKKTLNLFSLLLKQFPENWKILLISRVSPPSCLLTHTLQSLFQILGEELLSFNQTEIRELGERFGLILTKKQLEQIEEKTEGWIFSILVLFNTCTSKELISPKAYHHLYLFFEETIWRQFSCGQKRFLLRTCLLDKLYPVYCDFILKTKDSQRLLISFEKRNLFIKAQHNGSYRYHPLFKIFLQDKLRTSPLVDADKEYLAFASRIEALNPYRSLPFYWKGADYEKVLLLTISFPYWVMSFAEYEPEMIAISAKKYPPLLLLLVLLSFYRGDLKKCLFLYGKYEEWIKTGKPGANISASTVYLYLYLKAQLTAISAERIFTIWKEYRRFTLPPASSAYLLYTQSMTSFFNGPLDFSAILCNSKKYETEFASISHQIFGCHGPTMEKLLFAEACLEKNEISAALSYIEEAQNACLSHYENALYFLIRCRLAIILYAAGQKKKALQTLAALREISESDLNVQMDDNLNALLTKLKIWEKEEESARNWLKEKPLSSHSFYLYRIEEYMTTAYSHLLLRQYDELLTLTDKLLLLVRRYGKLRYTAELLVLQSIARKQKKEDASSYLRPLYEAVLLAQKYKYKYLFINFTGLEDSLALLLKEHSLYLFTGLNESCIRSLIAAIRNVSSTPERIARETPAVKLSPKQMEMLLYLSRGFHYEEICQATGLRITTIRTHISKLYEKLAVSNKKDALARATELGLFNI